MAQPKRIVPISTRQFRDQEKEICEIAKAFSAIAHRMEKAGLDSLPTMGSKCLERSKLGLINAARIANERLDEYERKWGQHVKALKTDRSSK